MCRISVADRASHRVDSESDPEVNRLNGPSDREARVVPVVDG